MKFRCILRKVVEFILFSDFTDQFLSYKKLHHSNQITPQAIVLTILINFECVKEHLVQKKGLPNQNEISLALYSSGRGSVMTCPNIFASNEVSLKFDLKM